jgi:type I restriction enzyme M protein
MRGIPFQRTTRCQVQAWIEFFSLSQFKLRRMRQVSWLEPSICLRASRRKCERQKRATLGFGAESGLRQDYVRDDFTVTTGNKQLNYLQHIMSILKVGGSAAVVMPDNVLFEGGAGEALRRRLLEEFDFHTLLRLPTGVFYSQGVKANVLFFDRATLGTGVATRDLWAYDLRTNQRVTLRERPFKHADLDDFVTRYGSKFGRARREETERFRRFSYEDLVKRDKLNLDLLWLKDAGATDPDTLPPPAEIAAEIVDSLETALEKFRLVAAKLG